jgi:phosphoribosylanthranilate isomerase
MRVKICGITNYEDALFALKCGADALGFVFYEKSPRYITPLKAKEIISKLPPFFERVGLFVNSSAYDINSICKTANISLAQLHFEADEKIINDLNYKHIRVGRAQSNKDIKKYEDKYRLVDAFVQSYGGEGKRLNLEWFRDVDCSKIILAGGLKAENLNELKGYGFYGIDVSSGVESKKGVKSQKLISEFLKKSKEIETV